jgi:H+/Cl- antiporter ClcA
MRMLRVLNRLPVCGVDAGVGLRRGGGVSGRADDDVTRLRVGLPGRLWRFGGLVAMAAAVGTVSAWFLWSLDAVTRVRFGAPWLIWLLPAGGLAVAWLYRAVGGRAEGGTGLLIDEIHEPHAGVPRRMAPLILFGTLASHLFGASVGREGTALQIGGGMAAVFARWFPQEPAVVRLLLMSGMAAGFGGVFGAPLAGACFAWEILRRRTVRWTAIFPCLLAAWVAHLTCRTWGAGHLYELIEVTSRIGWLGLWRVVVVALLAAGCGAAFVGGTRRLGSAAGYWLPDVRWRAAVGGLVILGLCGLPGTRDFLGLGVLGEFENSPTLPGFFSDPGHAGVAWLWKGLFTAVALAAGFKGGEVTPLLFIGAALGNSVAGWIGGPVDLLAAAGLVAIFSATTKAPLASALLGIEFFGIANALPLLLASLVAWRCCGKSGLYTRECGLR